MMPRSAGAVIYRKSRNRIHFLLLHYPAGHWDFVKGKMEKGENKMQTVVREAFEETGIRDLRFVDGFEHGIRYEFPHNGRIIRKRVTFFLAETRTRDVLLSHEHVGYAWPKLERAIDTITFENSRNVLLHAFDYIHKTKLSPAPRTQPQNRPDRL